MVLSNEKATKVPSFSLGDFEFYSFPTTKLLSSYLFALAAGPYKEIANKNSYRGIPMSLFCRSSLHEHLVKLSEFIFEVTDGAMKVYEEYFGY
jgi:aminopeptidase N